MWTTKTFETVEKRDLWIKKNKHRYQINPIFIKSVEYRKLVKPTCFPM